jgi:hypothetical protein
MLKSLNESKSLISISANLLIIDSNGPNHALAINNKEPPERGPIQLILLILNQHTISPGNILSDIRDQRNINGSQSTILFISFSPGEMREVRIDRYGEDLGVDFLAN